MVSVGIEFVKLEETPEIVEAVLKIAQPFVDRNAIEQQRLKRKKIKEALKEKAKLRKLEMTA